MRNQRKTLKEQAIISVFWTAIERFSVQIMQFVIGLIVARLLSPSDFGLIAMLSIFIALAQSFIDSFTSIRHTKSRDETEHCAAMGYKGSLSGQIFTGKESLIL